MTLRRSNRRRFEVTRLGATIRVHAVAARSTSAVTVEEFAPLLRDPAKRVDEVDPAEIPSRDFPEFPD